MRKSLNKVQTTKQILISVPHDRETFGADYDSYNQQVANQKYLKQKLNEKK